MTDAAGQTVVFAAPREVTLEAELLPPDLHGSRPQEARPTGIGFSEDGKAEAIRATAHSSSVASVVLTAGEASASFATLDRRRRDAMQAVLDFRE